MGEPHDRLTRLCDAMTDALVASPDYADTVKCAIFLDDGNRGGLVLFGWEDDATAVAHLFAHLRAIFNANGQEMLVVPLNQG